MNVESDPLRLLCRKFTDEGLLVEAGWIGLRMHAIPRSASEDYLRSMRMAYFAGARHLFTSLMTVLHPDKEPAEIDLNRLQLIHRELQTFAKRELEQLTERHGGPAT